MKMFIIILFVSFFLTSVIWWSFTGVQVTASLLRSPGLYSIFWPVSVVWIVSIRPPISNSSSPLTKPLGTVPSMPIIISITVPLIFHSLFFLVFRQDPSSCLSFHFLWFALYGLLGQQNPPYSKFSFFLIITRSGFLTGIRWFVCISKCQRILWVLFSRTYSGLCIYYLLVWSNFNFLHSSEWTTFPTQSCLVL